MDFYRIRVEGHLDAAWLEWLGLTHMEHEADNCSLLTGPLADQAALHGCLLKLRDGGIVLLGLEKISSERGK